MRLRAAILTLLLVTAAWGDPQGLPQATVEALANSGWQAIESEPGEVTWENGQARLLWSEWEPQLLGTRWRLGSEQARLFHEDAGATLGLERGWALQVVNLEQPEEFLMTLATTLAPDGIVWSTAGYSVQNRPIDVARMGRGDNRTLIFGVFHGDEPEGETACLRLLDFLKKNPQELEGRSVLICPVLNPDGLLAGTRTNANQVDVNRNFPAANWNSEGRGTRYWGGPNPSSEPETLAVIKMLEEFIPDKIVSIHAPLHNVNYDGPAADLAKRMSAENGYVVEPDIGYPTPGSFGTFAGRERGIPVITLEFPEGDGEALWLENKRALLEAIRYAPPEN